MPLPSLYNNELPQYCTPTNEFLTQASIYFGICVPTPLAFISSVLGTLSIISWLFAQMPQIYKNYQIQSTAGLSIFFLAEWLLGDLTNLLGAILTHQAGWQVIIASYYTFVDICLVVQFFWYTYVKPSILGSSLHSSGSSQTADSDSDSISALSPINTEFSDGPRTEMKQSRPVDPPKSTAENSHPQFLPVNYDGHGVDLPRPRKHSLFDWTAMASPRTVLVGATTALMTPARAAPVPVLLGVNAVQMHIHGGTSLELVGTVVSWSSTFLYLGSRIPQLYKNWSRKSTAGLSPLLFLAAFSGNLFYSTSLLTNPNAWSSYGPHGGHGWADSKGSDRQEWILRATPFFLGAAGVLFMDAMMGVQFLAYGEREEELVRVRDSYGHSRWEKVSGWMRGWVPRMSSRSRIVDLAESQRLLSSSRDVDPYYSRYGGT